MVNCRKQFTGLVGLAIWVPRKGAQLELRSLHELGRKVAKCCTPESFHSLAHAFFVVFLSPPSSSFRRPPSVPCRPPNTASSRVAETPQRPSSVVHPVLSQFPILDFVSLCFPDIHSVLRSLNWIGCHHRTLEEGPGMNPDGQRGEQQ